MQYRKCVLSFSGFSLILLSVCTLQKVIYEISEKSDGTYIETYMKLHEISEMKYDFSEISEITFYSV